MHNHEDKQLGGVGFDLGAGSGSEMSAESLALPVDELSHGAASQEAPVERHSVEDISDVRDFMLVAASSSERGARLGNEDCAWYGDDCACLSDGIGGAPFGDVMSRLCCGAFDKAWKSALDAVGDAAGRWALGEWCMYQAFVSVDAFVSKVSSCLGEGSGATLVAVAACEGELMFGRMGDSTAYVLCDDGGLEHVFGNDRGRIRAGAMRFAPRWDTMCCETAATPPCRQRACRCGRV